jgi:hypothetical protein
LPFQLSANGRLLATTSMNVPTAWQLPAAAQDTSSSEPCGTRGPVTTDHVCPFQDSVSGYDGTKP